MVAAHNRYFDAWRDKTLTPQNVRDYAKGALARDDAFVRELANGLADGRWPAVARADVNRLIREVNKGRPYLAAVADAKTADAAWRQWQRVPPFEPQGAAAADIRTRLGLPPFKG